MTRIASPTWGVTSVGVRRCAGLPVRCEGTRRYVPHMRKLSPLASYAIDP
eukprot:COSAG01_NODE_3767_length_5718_cov_4.404342_5_plen_50_part_00